MRTRFWCCLTFGTLFSVLAGVSLAAEDDPLTRPPACVAAPAAKSPQDKKAILIDVTRVSTATVAESAAQKKKTEGTSPDETPKPPEDSAVTELRPLPPDSQATSSDKKDKKKSKSGPVKNIHGTVYGGAGGPGQGGGVAVGGSTKSGKTSIFVEEQRSQTR